jgi:ferredoxin
LESGAALVGFAPISRFDNAPASVHPHTIYPDTRTAIAIGIPQIRGTLKTIEQGTYWQSYNCDSYWYINEVLSVEILRKICMLLESKGYTSVPVHNPFMPHVGRQIRADQPDGPDGIISLRMVGVAAGLGELGHSKVFLTPEFGPRQRMYAVLTEAELEPTPLFSGKVCDGCLACVRECEACAIGSDRNIEFNIEDQVYSHAALDLEACGVVHRGDDPRYSPFWNGTEKAGEGPGYNQFSQHRFRHLSICGGRGCVRACLDHLEKAGRISSSFKTPFIAENRWKLNEAP